MAWLTIPAPENRPDSSPVPDIVEKMRAEMDGEVSVRDVVLEGWREYPLLAPCERGGIRGSITGG